MIDGNTETTILDIRGQVCPSTLLVSLKEINKHKDSLKSGKSKLKIITDNRDAVTTIPESCKSMGYPCDVEKSVEGYYIITIKKSSTKDK
ncbi:MAG TPA: sulfurtransferase TusA family protein [Nitrospirae bacterium]|nr:sulfurtransferase TusA family protein [Nitrospirota bacterium]